VKKSIVALLCVALLSFSLLAGCSKTSGTGSDTDVSPSPEPETSQTPDNTTGIETPEKTGETKSVDVSIEGMTESVEMSEYLCTVNGQMLSIFIDDTKYNVYNFEGELEIAPITDAGVEPETKVHLYFMIDKKADIAAQEGLTQFAGSTDEGKTKIGEYDAYVVSSKTEDNSFTVYYMALGDSTLAVSAYANAETEEGHLARMLAMVGTVTQK
jgi:predicted small secreted protein